MINFVYKFCAFILHIHKNFVFILIIIKRTKKLLLATCIYKGMYSIVCIYLLKHI